VTAEARDDPVGGLQRQVDAVRDLLSLLEGPRGDPDRLGLDGVRRELDTALEELDAAAEELVDQHERLARAQRAVDVERRRFRELFEDAPDAYLVTDRHGMVQRANRAALHLLDRSLPAVLGVPIVGFVPPDERGEWRRRVARLSSGGSLADWQTRIVRDGDVVPVAIDVAPAVVRGHVQELRWLVRDSTDRVRGQQHLRTAFERATGDRDRLADLDAWKSTFIAAAAHDLRTPLQSIAALATDLLDGVDDDALHKGLLRIVDEADDLSGLLSDLLDLDRFTRGAVRLRDTWVDIAEVVRGEVDRGGGDDGDVTVQLTRAVVRAEPRRVAQIVANLLRNARQHTPSGTPVWVRTSPVDNGAVILVEDAGPGLPASPDRREIFAPFTRARRNDGTTTGAGIGLSLVTLFAQLHGGRAWAEDRPGGGARFVVFLPTDPGARFHAPRHSATGPPDGGRVQRG
jgi:PAS domain S-box-containing protein